MTNRDLSIFGRKSVPVTRGVNPIVQFQDEVNRLFGDFFGDVSFPRLARATDLAVSPALDIDETDKEYKVTAELPGMEAKDIHITAADGYLTIKGEKKQESHEEHKGYFRQERSYGSFQRIVALPENANFEKADASVKNGILTLAVPKKAGAQSKERNIEVKQVA